MWVWPLPLSVSQSPVMITVNGLFAAGNIVIAALGLGAIFAAGLIGRRTPHRLPQHGSGTTRTRPRGDMRRFRLPTTALVVAATLIAACSGETSNTTLPTDTTLAPTTTSTDTPTTNAPPTTTTSTIPSSVNDDAEGSGCTPGAGDLPNGEWYGGVASVSADEIEFDLACWFTGDAAARAAAEDGEESPPPNDYYVRNVNTTLRTVPVGDEVMILWYPQFGDPTSEATITYAEWRDVVDDRGEFMAGIWIEVEGGAITSIREQWVP